MSSLFTQYNSWHKATRKNSNSGYCGYSLIDLFFKNNAPFSKEPIYAEAPWYKNFVEVRNKVLSKQEQNKMINSIPKNLSVFFPTVVKRNRAMFQFQNRLTAQVFTS